MRISKSSIILVAIGFAVGMTSNRLLMHETATVHAQDKRSAQSSTPTLVIGDQTVSVGMPQAAVIAKFSGKYKLISTDPSRDLFTPTEGMLIMRNDNDVIGSIGFRDGKLINAQRDWGSFYSKEGIDRLWAALDGALSQQVPRNTWLPIQIRRTELEAPQIGARTIDMRFADRTIQLQKGRSEGPPANTVYETYSVSEVLPFPLL
jgi:hypothetical protein